jgi:MoxR-like ATPase
MTEIVADLENQTKKAAEKPTVLPLSRRADKDKPEDYLPDPGLVDAFGAMLLLRRPLLLTGEPGTGKTQAAQYLNWKLGLAGDTLRFDAKSTSSARDLFYTFDTIGRFYHMQTEKVTKPSSHFIHYNALGVAILRAKPMEEVQDCLPPGFSHPGPPSQSVVLIDEVDKAPRDFPNDVLNELENLVFRVPELDNREFRAKQEFQPLVLITSNSEKNLPAAFLRRCLYYHIQKPSRDRFSRILESRLKQPTSTPLNNDALSFLMFLREPVVEVAKKPSTAELIDFVLLLEALGAKPGDRFTNIQPVVKSALVTLLKGEDGSATLLDAWLTQNAD